MRLSLRAAVAALALGLGAAASPAAAQTAPKMGYVDVSQVMDQVPGRAEAQAAFQKEAEGIRAEMQRMSDSLQNAVQAYQKEQATLTAAVRQTREKTLQDRQQSYQQRAQQLQERGASREQELVDRFEKIVRDAINDVRTAEGLTMVFAYGPNSALLSADKSMDVTDKVLARMRTIAAAQPAPATRPAAAPAGPVAAPAGATRRP
ncbi:OmpH family outer membrane protein [Roseisolibacter sp. H3M3-2]|uniref:OmpH family outer membrane protein n=1 Tax=Roseisolibacter sp. H3M3-2 TaxID=3031323 RepID=UPI0023D9EC58|nr:OmpH family outer membrane protein [Roseisolibacter sp. H3M3-2]MDF1502649.1 OmpH family outer membrane protein [Roseisolibacter sp. H3M3-2]